jgi:hypothetical protein
LLDPSSPECKIVDTFDTPGGEGTEVTEGLVREEDTESDSESDGDGEGSEEGEEGGEEGGGDSDSGDGGGEEE